MNTFSLSRLAFVLIASAALSACSSTTSTAPPSTQVAPGPPSRPVLNATEAKNFTIARYFTSVNPNEAAWSPSPIRLPQKPDYVVGPAGQSDVTHTTIQAAVDAAINQRTTKRLYIAILPGNYEGTVYVPAASGSLTLYGTGEKATDVNIALPLDSEMDRNTWRRVANPSGKYMPGKPAWYMFDSCLNRSGATIGLMCSAIFWSQNNGLQLSNMTIANTLGDNVDGGKHQAVALRSDGDKVQIDNVNILGRQNTFLVTNSDLQNRFLVNRQTRTLVTNSYVEGDVDAVAGRGTVVFDNTTFYLVNSRTRQEGYVFAPATPPNQYYGFLAINSRFSAAGDNVAQLGRAWDLNVGQNGYIPGQSTNGQLVIRDSVINSGFNTAQPWGAAADSGRPFTGNVGYQDKNGALIRDLNDVNANRLWEFNNRGIGSDGVSEPRS